MKVYEIMPTPNKSATLRKLITKIKIKAKNPAENEPATGWNQSPYQGSTPGTFLNR